MAYSKRSNLRDELSTVLSRLGSHQSEYSATISRSVANGHPPKLWRVSDRLTTEDIDQLVKRYQTGTTARELAAEYKIGLTSIKRLIR
jgi:hypothetical protein